MLRNELHVGKRVWNRRRWIKRPGTNKRVYRERPRDEWKVVDQPELRIITAGLWQGVLERQQLLPMCTAAQVPEFTRRVPAHTCLPVFGSVSV